jgi:hypothetical protein
MAMSPTPAALALAVLTTSSLAAAETALIQAADPEDRAPTRIRDGVEVLQPTDEEHTPEQASFAFDPVRRDTGIVVMMGTGRLDGPAGPYTGATIQVGNIQGACMPIKLVKDESTLVGVTVRPQVAGFRYLTQRQADENRAFHHPEVEAIGGGRFAISANWDRNGNTNTERYMQVVDSNCNLIPLTGNVTLRENNTSATIMAKDNDNCSGRQAGGGGSVHLYPDGTAAIMSHELCNGNGRDDGWANYLHVTCAADNSSCHVDKKFDVSTIQREERSRGRCEQLDLDGDGAPETSVCCGTEGNSQPQREGVWCSGVDHATGAVLYKEQVAYMGQTADGRPTWAMRIKMLAERDLTGRPTGTLVMQYNMHRGNNNDNQKGGYDDKLMMAIARPTRDGLNITSQQDITQAVIEGQVEMTHATMFQTFAGTADAPRPVFSFLTPNHNGSGAVKARVLNIDFGADHTFRKGGVFTLGGPYDGQKYSKYLGNNPNDQGRNFTDCHIVDNPFVAEPGKAQGLPVINLCALTGKLTSAGIASMKPDLFFEVWSTIGPTATEPDPGTGDDAPGDDRPDGPGVRPTGGCAAAGSSGGLAALLLFATALIAGRRRGR